MVPPLSELVSFDELKRLRLVCRNFNEIVRASPRYVNSQVKFGRRWKMALRQLTLPGLPKWENVFFNRFPMTENKFSRQYWNVARLTVKTLTLYKMKGECEVFANCIKECVMVENVTVDNVLFNERKTHEGENGQQREIRTTCAHQIFPGPELFEKTLKCITIQNQNIIPMCLLDLFQRKCNGVLEEFNFGGKNMPEAERLLYVPTQEQVRRKIQSILKENVLTLKKISLGGFRSNGDGMFIADLPNVAQNLQLEQITFSLPRQNFEETLIYFNCIRNLKTNVQLRALDGNQYRHIKELNLIFDGNFSYCESLLFVIDKLKPELEVLRLEFQANILEEDFNLGGTLETANLLQTFVAKKSKNFHPAGRNFNTEFLNNLPPSLKQLEVDLSPAPTLDIFSKMIEQAKCARITQLIIGNGGKEFNNEHMHTIIRSMPLLQDLKVISAAKLSDNGICSIASEVAQNIINSKSYSLLATPELIFQKETKENLVILSELKYLRKISFRGCNISDVSIKLAFHFPELRSVDLSSNLNVTDIGLLWLCKQNPSIEKLTVKDNIKVSHFGLNQLITICPTLSRIYTTHVVCDRRLCELNGFEHPRFNQAVHVSHTHSSV